MNDEMLLQLLNEIKELQRRMDLERHKKPLVYDGSIEMELDRIREKIAELEGSNVNSSVSNGRTRR